jgi:hypothetical protein
MSEEYQSDIRMSNKNHAKSAAPSRVHRTRYPPGQFGH